MHKSSCVNSLLKTLCQFTTVRLIQKRGLSFMRINVTASLQNCIQCFVTLFRSVFVCFSSFEAAPYMDTVSPA